MAVRTKQQDGSYDVTYEGRVLGLGRRADYLDSYYDTFYALVWDDEAGEAREVAYGTNRFEDPNSAEVDATDEVRARYEAAEQARVEARLAAEAAEEAARPYVGRTVRVVRGRKVPVGTTGVVVWHGVDRYGGNRYRSRWGGWGGYNASDHRVGIRQESGEVVFTSAANVEVTGAAN